MQRYFCLAITAILAIGCSNHQETSAEPVPAACVIKPDPHEPRICTMHYAPVCGCDSKTYGNACVAKGAGVQRFEPGACEQQQTPD